MKHAPIAAALQREAWCVTPSAIDEDLVYALLQQARAAWAAHGFHAAGVGRGADFTAHSALRGDHILWLDDQNSASRACLRAFEQMRLAINETCFLGLFDFEAHFARFAPGARYARHLDRFRDDTARVVSCVLYLNPDWRVSDGGQLRLYLGADSDEHVDVLPTAGTLVSFLSDRFPHEVLPAGRERWSIAGWFRRRPQT